jgi:hypothetical protein
MERIQGSSENHKQIAAVNVPVFYKRFGTDYAGKKWLIRKIQVQHYLFLIANCIAPVVIFSILLSLIFIIICLVARTAFTAIIFHVSAITIINVACHTIIFKQT